MSHYLGTAGALRAQGHRLAPQRLLVLEAPNHGGHKGHEER